MLLFPLIYCLNFVSTFVWDASSKQNVQGVTAAVIIHIRDRESKRRTNTVILTFASPQPPKHITAGYMRVPVDPYIPTLCAVLTVRDMVTALERAKTRLHV